MIRNGLFNFIVNGLPFDVQMRREEGWRYPTHYNAAQSFTVFTILLLFALLYYHSDSEYVTVYMQSEILVTTHYLWLQYRCWFGLA